MKTNLRIPGVSMTRRSFLKASAALLYLAWQKTAHAGPVVRRPVLSDYPFRLGVASGDPDHHSVVLWTRLAPKPLEGGGMPQEPVEVRWEVARDESFRHIVRKGTAIADPAWAHSVHVEVTGLQPDRWYWYRFFVGLDASPIGRTWTAPAPAAEPDPIRFAFASCQHYEQGLYTAYEHMVREDLDFILHLGDYIYEDGVSRHAIRQHDGPEVFTLEQYRNRYALYKSDPALQAAHAAAPWIVTWDDHEVDNNYAGMIPEARSAGILPFAERRAHAYKAYFEHMPLRPSARPNGPWLPLHRRLAFGRLLRLFVLDTRQYRTDQPCGDGRKAPCPEALDPRATLLGPVQKRWLMTGLEQSDARWNALAQQIMMARVDRKAGPGEAYSMDQWPGYEFERRTLLEHIFRTGRMNTVVLTGDIHSHWANELPALADTDAPCAAVEFVGSSISSGGDGTPRPPHLDTLCSENPFVKFHNAQRGYVACEVSPREWRAHFRVLDFVTKPGSRCSTAASFVVLHGQPRLHPA